MIHTAKLTLIIETSTIFKQPYPVFSDLNNSSPPPKAPMPADFFGGKNLPSHCQNGTEKVFRVIRVFREFNDHLFTPCSPIIVLTENPYCRIFKNKPHWLFALLTTIVKLINWKTFHISCKSPIFIVIL